MDRKVEISSDHLMHIASLLVVREEDIDDDDPKNVALRARLSSVMEIVRSLATGGLAYTVVPIRPGKPWRPGDEVGEAMRCDPNGMSVVQATEEEEASLPTPPTQQDLNAMSGGPSAEVVLAEWALENNLRILGVGITLDDIGVNEREKLN